MADQAKHIPDTSRTSGTANANAIVGNAILVETKTPTVRLYGMAPGGDKFGSIFSFTTDGAMREEYVFQGNPGKYPQSTPLIELPDGTIWGVATQGGPFDYGMIFQYNLATGVYKRIIDLDVNTYSAFLTYCPINGKFYGVSPSGSDSFLGTIFSYNPTTNTLANIVFFDDTNGSSPSVPMTLGSDGLLYGTTVGGGDNGAGIIFTINPSNDSFTIKKHLLANGPLSTCTPFLEISSGVFMAQSSGGPTPSNQGSLYEYNSVTNTVTVRKALNNFTTAVQRTGNNPQGGTIIKHTNGKIYGFNFSGGVSNHGTLFEYDPVSKNYVVKKDLTNTVTGGQPSTAITMDPLTGLMYAKLNNTINNNLVEYNPTTDVLRTVYNFTMATEGGQCNTPIRTSTGRFIGVNSSGGLTDVGVMYEFKPATASVTKLMDFNYAPDGAYPNGSLMVAANGVYYGIASAMMMDVVNVSAQTVDGALSKVFSFNPTTKTLTIICQLTGGNGSSTTAGGTAAVGSLHQNPADGFLYFLGSGGGQGGGVMNIINTATGIPKLLALFNAPTFGTTPYGSMMTASNNLMYWIGRLGGANGLGQLMRKASGGGVGGFSNVVNITTAGGGFGSFCTPVEISGVLYFVGYGGFGDPNDYGTLSSYNIATTAYTKLRTFADATGGKPTFIMKASNNLLYGTTQFGGSNGGGVLFSFNPTGSVYTVLRNFTSSTDGGEPIGELTEVNGVLYGTTRIGGIKNRGTVYSFTISGSIFSKLIDLQGNVGNPIATKLLAVSVTDNA